MPIEIVAKRTAKGTLIVNTLYMYISENKVLVRLTLSSYSVERSGNADDKHKACVIMR